MDISSPPSSDLEHRSSDLDRRSSLLALIGKTPLVRLRALEPRADVEIYAKAEWHNPGGSVKDRAAARMIEDGVRRGRLKPGGTLIDATSGNTGIAYAMIGAACGYLVRLCIPANVTTERLRMLHAYGADVILTDPMEGSDGAIREAQRLHALEPDLFYPDQYGNDANWRAHYDTTACEIWQQTGGRVTHFVAGLGTSGTFVGTTMRLRDLSPAIRAYSVQPDSPLHAIEGLKHMDSAIVPSIYRRDLADDDLRVSTEDAQAMTRRLASELGLLVGVSSGAAAVAAVRVARPLTSGVVVTIFADSGARYLSESFWSAPDDRSMANDEPRETNARMLNARCQTTRAIEAAIRRHAAETYPFECCGALIGTSSEAEGVSVVEALALSNVTSEGPRRRFRVSPDDYRRAEARAAESGAELVGFYHSHPDHPAVPSQYDLDHAWPNLSYVIVSVVQGNSADMRSWRLRPDRSAFEEEQIAILTS